MIVLSLLLLQYVVLLLVVVDPFFLGALDRQTFMAKIRFFVMEFPSHQNWAEGYQRVSKAHEVKVDIIPCDRWKFRMQVGSAELEKYVAEDDEVLVVDSMFDVTPLVALLRTTRQQQRHPCPQILVYVHENQLTTPFTGQDRDKANNTHWHYGMCNWRSLLVSDGFVFNTRQHLEVFAQALPKLINEQCPRDTVAWHLEKAERLIRTKCTVLNYGLDLDDLVVAQQEQQQKATANSGIPVILWNARLEEDKDPATFLEVMGELKRARATFGLLVLGVDPSKGARWRSRFQQEFSEELLHLGWCPDRNEYAKWLNKAHIVLSTSQHETFGASILESVFCGALPLLPKRLCYPEIFSPQLFQEHFYSSTHECVTKLTELLKVVSDPVERAQAVSRTQSVVERFRWSTMGSAYDIFFSVVTSEGVKAAGLAAEVEAESMKHENESVTGISSQMPMNTVLITEPSDPRVALYRPKSLRDHKEYHEQLRAFHVKGLEPPSLHGGRRAIVRMLEALASGSRVKPLSFLTTPDLAQSVLAPKHREHCMHAPVYIAKKGRLDDIRGQKLNAGDSILAIVQFPLVAPLDELIASPPILTLDDVRNAENVGSILRTAFCLGITSIILSKTAWAALRDTRSARCSMGTIFFHKFYKAESLELTLAQIRSAGIRVYGVEITSEAKPVAPHGQDRKWNAVLGNENVGLTPDIREMCDSIVFVPQAHGDSLNVGHAAAITMFELGRESTALKHDSSATCT